MKPQNDLIEVIDNSKAALTEVAALSSKKAGMARPDTPMAKCYRSASNMSLYREDRRPTSTWERTEIRRLVSDAWRSSLPSFGLDSGEFPKRRENKGRQRLSKRAKAKATSRIS